MLDRIRNYKGEDFGKDVAAGLTASAVVIPKAMAYAAIAGLPLVAGLYTSVIPLIVYALLGSSRPLSVTTTSTLAVLTATSLAAYATDTGTLLATSSALALLVGIFLVAGGALRLGAVANLISDPVLTGFKAGIGLVIVLDQAPKLLGIHISKAGFFRDLWSIVHHVPEASPPTIAIGALGLALMLLLEHLVPRVPAALVTVATGIALSAAVDLQGMGVSLVGPVQAGLPSFAVPDLAHLEALWPAALGIALMSFVETAAAGRAFLKRGEVVPDPNRELLATGFANLATSFFSSMPAGGGTSQTAVNDSAGARTKLAGLVTALMVVLTLLWLAPVFAVLPHATLAGVVIVASIGLVSPADFRALRKVRAMEFRWAFIAMFGVLLLGTLKGILVAVVVSLVGLILHANRHPIQVLGRKPGTSVFRPRSSEHPEDESVTGLLMVRPYGAFYFGNATRISQAIRTLVLQLKPEVVVLDLSSVPTIEFTALKALAESDEKLRDSGTTLWLAALTPEALELVQRIGLAETLGRERMFFTLEQAVERFETNRKVSETAYLLS